MNSYITLLLGTDVMASKETQRKLIKDNQSWPKDLSVEVQRKTVSSRAPTFEKKCPMQIIIFLGQDDCFFSPLKVVFNIVITHFSKLMLFFAGRVTWSKPILINCPFFSVLKLPLFKFLKLCNTWKAPNRAHYYQKDLTTWTKRQNSFMTWLLDWSLVVQM